MSPFSVFILSKKSANEFLLQKSTPVLFTHPEQQKESRINDYSFSTHYGTRKAYYVLFWFPQ